MRNFVIVAALGLGVASAAWAESDREAAVNRLDHAGRVLHEIMAAPDKGIPEEVLEHAKCVAVVPHLLKGGFVMARRMVEAWPRAGRHMDGARQRFLPLLVAASACRLELKASIWS
jgi:lipid-binding SYLF domain-containing protein